jgi:hypothetical protein
MIDLDYEKLIKLIHQNLDDDNQKTVSLVNIIKQNFNINGTNIKKSVIVALSLDETIITKIADKIRKSEAYSDFFMTMGKEAAEEMVSEFICNVDELTWK